MAEKEIKDGEDVVIEVKKATLDAILDKLEGLEKQKDKDAKTISKLLAVADRGRLMNYESQHEQGEIIRKARLSTWNGEVVLAWKTLKNDVRFTDNGGVVAEQTVKIFTLNREKPEKPSEYTMDQIVFARNSSKIDAEIVEVAKQKSGRELYTLRLEDGFEVKLDIAFLN